MSKSAKRRAIGSPVAAVPAARPVEDVVGDPKSKKAHTRSKQSRVITMLQSPAGATIAAIMKATGWQQHSVRGFLAGVVRKRLNLKLTSKKVDGERVYQVVGADGSRSKPHQSKRRSF
jgi:hypothetical protein